MAIVYTIMTLGLVQLFALWHPIIRVWLYYTRSPNDVSLKIFKNDIIFTIFSGKILHMYL